MGIKASINKGLTATLIEAFPNIISVNRTKVEHPTTIDPNWLVGFVDGEGCFNVNIINSKTHKIGTQVKVRFTSTFAWFTFNEKVSPIFRMRYLKRGKEKSFYLFNC